MSGVIISIEGVNGVGKSYFAQELRKEFISTNNVVFFSEISVRTGTDIDLKILELLSHKGDRFFRMGLPITETFLLLALKMYDYENSMLEPLAEGKVVVEDRSIDTIAIYQSIIMCENQPKKALGMASEIFNLTARYRRPPDLTFLIEDDFDLTIERAQKRNGDIYKEDEIKIIRAVSEIYPKYAEMHKERFMRFDLQKMSSEDVFKIMKQNILERI